MRGGPRFAVVEIEAEDRPLDAVVYLRGAEGFSEDRCIDLPERRRLLIVVTFAGECGRGVRIDPTDEVDVVFRMRWWTRRSRAGLRRLVAIRLARQPGLVPTPIGPDPEHLAAGGLAPAFVGSRWTDNLGHVWSLAAAEARATPPPPGPTLSFLTPVYEAEPRWLDALRDSVLEQGPGVELVLCDDGSRRTDTRRWLDAHGPGGGRARPELVVLRAAANRGVAAATNAALAAARGDWVGLVDHDDMLSPFAVDRIRRALAAAPRTVFLYTDEAIVDGDGRPVSLFAKPAFDPALLSGLNYVNHLSLYRRDRLVGLGGLREGFQGSQDYELVLRYLAGDGAPLAPGEIVHLPYPAYQWRQTPGSLSHAGLGAATDAARRALAEHYGRALGAVAVEPAAILPDLHRLRFATGPLPRVSVVIPNRDAPALIGRVLEDLFERTARAPFEVIVVDNGTTDPATLAIYDRWTAARGLRVDIRPEPFNFARMANRGADMARGDAILLLNNDVQVLEPRWLDEMVECLAFTGTGIVGAKLLYPDGAIQHAGVILGLGDFAGHWFYKDRADEPGPMGRLAVRNNLTVVTAACMLATRACWEDVGGMDEARFAVAYNDVDFCARARERGHGVIWTPFATLIHDESASRGSDLVGEKARRFQREKQALAERHDTARFEDPAYSPWNSRRRSRPRFVGRDSLPPGRHFHGFPGG
jgi:GT2 family glycosyltransferase